jgi:drug/metabolite transporter (DMT)-like permease
MTHAEEPKAEPGAREAPAWWTSGPASGMACMLVATALFATMQLLIRVAGTTVPAVEISFWRSFFGLLIQLPLLWWFGLASIRTARLRLHGLRGLLHGVSMMLWFVALMEVPLAEATALEFASPIVATTLAILFLGEVVRVRRIVALCAGVIGVMLVVRPGFQEVSNGQVLALVSVALWAGCQLIIRELGRTETAFTQGFYMVLFFTPITLVSSLPVWVWPSVDDLMLLFLVGVVATAGTWFYGEAFRRAEMGAILPLEATKLLWSVAYGLLFFSEEPLLLTLLGGVIIFGAAVYITLREARLSRLGKT